MAENPDSQPATDFEDLLLPAERTVLERLALGTPLPEVLEGLVLDIQAHTDQAVGSVQLLDESGTRLVNGASPGLSAAYLRSIQGAPIGPLAGSCGTAAHERRAVIVEDIATDPRWSDYRTGALAAGLRACWSWPVMDESGKVLGTFAFYYRTLRRPSSEELQLAEAASRIARTAIRFGAVQARVQVQQRMLSTILAHLPGMAYRGRNDRPFTMEFVSDGCLALTGYGPESLVGNRGVSFADLIEPEDRDAVRAEITQAVERRQPYTLSYRIRNRDGSIRWVWEQGQAAGMSEDGSTALLEGFISDVTERKLLESQILQAQRLESIGTLAGGIAHDLNNVFSPMIMAADLLKAAPLDDRSRGLLETVILSAHRGAGLVRQILLFARGMEGRRIPVAPAALFADLHVFLESTLPKSIQVETRVAKGVKPIRGDPTQLGQVLLNLCVNARDAMPAGGRLLLAATPTHIPPEGARPHPDALPGGYVRIDVGDTGTGIPHEIQNRIFDPFFTTKDVGRGTGLGLSTSRSIVKSHNGFMTVGSEPGQGTTFSLFLPAVLDEELPPKSAADDGARRGPEPQAGPPPASPSPAPSPPASPRPSAAQPARGLSQRILVIEDEASVRLMMRACLESRGFRTTCFPDGAAALAHVSGADPAQTPDLAIVDMQMPGMDGPQTIAALHAILPHLPVVGVSGFSVGPLHTRAEAAGVRHFLDKPFTLEQLVRTVLDTLTDTHRPGGAR